MIDSDPVVIDDDNDEITQGDSNNPNHKCKPRMDMIIIDDVEDLTQNTIIDIIEIDDEPDLRNKTNQLKYLCDRIYRENKLLRIFVEKCLDLENTDGMLRVINRTLLRGYRETANDFKKSPECEETIQKAIDLIQADPEHKFSHVKFVCEVFKKHKFRRKVDFVTLSPHLKGSVENKLKRPNKISRMSKKHKTDIIIDLDRPVIFEVPIINLEEDVNLSININDKPVTNEIKLNEENENSNKENHLDNDGLEANNPGELNKNNEDITRNSSKNGLSIPNTLLSDQGRVDVSNQLLVPHRDEQYGGHISESNTMEQVKQIEKDIAFYKDAIAQLEEEEVVENSSNSPYIRCEKFKAKITKLYANLCLLTGEEPVKRYEVRLNVADGHPPGPVRELEKFINDNIGSNGEPPFPDFCDVVKCVFKANQSEQLGWNKPQIMREANLLFVQCGRALQQRRQRREWRDMLGRVKQKKLDYDPADEDPVLEARLEQNKRIALGKETDLLERYANMENEIPTTISNPNLTLEHDSDYNSENEDQEPKKYRQQAPSICIPPSSTSAHQQSNGTISCLIYTHRISKDCSNANITEDSQKSMDSINNLAKTEVKNEFCDINNVSEINKATIYNKIPIEDANMKANENSTLPNNLTNALDTPTSEPTETEDKINIKQEPEDVAMLLEELGDNYTSTIIDIEDPFLVIEISSDSSDGESD